MSDDRAVRHKEMQEQIAGLKSAAIALLERRGFDVRGKTPAEIRQILRRHPTKPFAANQAAKRTK